MKFVYLNVFYGIICLKYLSHGSSKTCCLKGWMEHNSTCYKYHKEKEYFATASNACSKGNAVLASIRSTSTLSFLLNWVKKACSKLRI